MLRFIQDDNEFKKECSRNGNVQRQKQQHFRQLAMQHFWQLAMQHFCASFVEKSHLRLMKFRVEDFSRAEMTLFTHHFSLCQVQQCKNIHKREHTNAFSVFSTERELFCEECKVRLVVRTKRSLIKQIDSQCQKEKIVNKLFPSPSFHES